MIFIWNGLDRAKVWITPVFLLQYYVKFDKTKVFALYFFGSKTLVLHTQRQRKALRDKDFVMLVIFAHLKKSDV